MAEKIHIAECKAPWLKYMSTKETKIANEL